MTSKERMLRALALGKPDRLPATVHQWQQLHLDTYLGGIDALVARQACGLDASIQYKNKGLRDGGAGMPLLAL